MWWFIKKINKKYMEKKLTNVLIDKRIEYWLYGINLFNPSLSPFYSKFNISYAFLSLYRYFYLHYPKSKFTSWLIKNTKIGTFRCLSNSCQLLNISTFLLFKNKLISVESHYLNHDGWTSDMLSQLSLVITNSLLLKKIKVYSVVHLPASVTFDVMAIMPSNPRDIPNIDLWETGVDYAYFP